MQPMLSPGPRYVDETDELLDLGSIQHFQKAEVERLSSFDMKHSTVV